MRRLDAATYCCSELLIKMASQGVPVIGLFTELSQKHITQGDRMCVQHFVAVMCHMNSN